MTLRNTQMSPTEFFQNPVTAYSIRAALCVRPRSCHRYYSACPKTHPPPQCCVQPTATVSQPIQGTDVAVCLSVAGMTFKIVRQILQGTAVWNFIKKGKNCRVIDRGHRQTDNRRTLSPRETFAFFRKERRTSNTRHADNASCSGLWVC